MEENHRRIHRSVCWQVVKLVMLTACLIRNAPLCRFYQNLQAALTEKCHRFQIKDPLSLQQLHDPPPELQAEEEQEKEAAKKISVYKRRRKRDRHQPDCSHGDSSVPDLDDCLDLFT